MWYVRAVSLGLKGYWWWGAFVNKADAEDLAGRVLGVVYHESELEKLRAKDGNHGEHQNQLPAYAEAGDVPCFQGE